MKNKYQRAEWAARRMEIAKGIDQINEAIGALSGGRKYPDYENYAIKALIDERCRLAQEKMTIPCILAEAV